MQYLGDFAEDYATLNFKFSTHKSDGTPISLATTPALSVYKANSTTQSTAGLTLTTDFDSVTGLHNVLIDLSADAFYAVGNDYSVVITAGTVDSISVVGTVLAHFSIENRWADKAGYSLTTDYPLKTDLADVEDIQSGLATAENQATINENVLTRSSHSAADVWSVSTRTLSSFGTLVADVAAAVWNYLLTAITTVGSIGKLIKDNVDGKVSERGMVMPVMTGRAYSATIIQDRKVEIVQGNTPRLTFDLNADYTGWTPYFGAKAKLSDTDYVIDPKEATWSDAANGRGYVDLTGTETATCGKFLGEVVLRSGDSRHTPIKFTLIIIGKVIDEL